MEKLSKELLSKRLRTAEEAPMVTFKEGYLNRGFTQISNVLLHDTTIPYRARFLYLLLLARAFNKDKAFPGQLSLAKEMGISTRQVRTHLKRLEAAKWIEIRQIGNGKTNRYVLLRH
jgi:DNA-binding HxlR family transcriptional regulator